jgi:hypothetical protein
MILNSRLTAHLCRLTAIVAGACTLFGMASTARAYTYSSEAQYASWASGSYTIYNDVWGNSNPSQWLNINSISNWMITSDQTGGGVKSYANIAFWPYYGISNSGSVWVYFNTSTPSSGSTYDNSFDCWDNSGNEIMIWENWGGGAGPAGSEKFANVSIAGATWNVYQGNVGHNVISFLRTSQRWSGTEYPLELLNAAKSEGLIGGTVLNEVQFGFEVSSTSGWQNFYLNGYSAGW